MHFPFILFPPQDDFRCGDRVALIQSPVINISLKLDGVMNWGRIEVHTIRDKSFDWFIRVIWCQHRDSQAERNCQVNLLENAILLFKIIDDVIVIIRSIPLIWRESVGWVQADISVAILV